MSETSTTPIRCQQLDLFYNTAHMESNELKHRRITAEGQCRVILNFFKGSPRGYFTPWEVQQYTGMQHNPITSIRRALHTLTTSGLIIKTDVMRDGEYGFQNHTWKLA